MKKITILALHLGYGGIEKCIITLANSLSNEYEIEIISTYKLYDKPSFTLNENIKVKYLMNRGPNKKEIKQSLKSRKYITFLKELLTGFKILKMKKQLMIETIKNCDSDIIISTRDIHNVWLGKYAKKEVLKIGWEHNFHNYNNKYINKIVKSIKDLDYFVLVSKAQLEFYQAKTKTKCIYIPNSIDEYPTKYSSLEEKNIVSTGRLSYEKGFDNLIEVFKLVNNVYPEWKLNIIGDGSEREKIEKLIKKYDLNNSVILHGYQNKEYVNNQLFHSSIYVMTSRSESFGLVLLEAFSYGLPCIAFDRADGAKELISDNWDGYLVKDSNIEQMAKRICELIGNVNRRVIMGANGIKKAQKYNIDTIKEEWIKLFKEKD